MASEIDAVTSEFVEALTNVLEASKNGAVSVRLRSQLAKARAKAEKLLTTKQYSDAVFQAAHATGLDWT